jgi:hypothetical protein
MGDTEPNGVVLITTKKGKKRKISVDVNSSVSLIKVISDSRRKISTVKVQVEFERSI